jgi:hypothetical protein
MIRVRPIHSHEREYTILLHAMSVALLSAPTWKIQSQTEFNAHRIADAATIWPAPPDLTDMMLVGVHSLPMDSP